MTNSLLDLIIIGAGPAGITAAVYAARKNLNFLVLTDDVGGQTAQSSAIENYTGHQFVTGADLTVKFEEHMKKYDIDIRENESVEEIGRRDGVVLVKTGKDEYTARSVVIASGKQSRELGVAGEKEFRNKGLAYCATCDGPLFAGRNVAVIGGGNSALDAALQLIKIAKQVFIINISPELGGDVVMKDKVIKSDKVTVMNRTQVTRVLGNKFVTGISIRNDEGETELSVEGVFVEIGLIPNSDFATGIDRNEQGEIKVNCRNETNVPGVFAAGDVTDVPEKQIIIAAGEGAKSVLTASRYLAGQE